MPQKSEAATQEMLARLGIKPEDQAAFRAAFAEKSATLDFDGEDLLNRLDTHGSFSEALGIGPKLLEAVYARAYSLLQVGQTGKAQDLFFALCVVNASVPEHWLGFGICLKTRREIETALFAFTQAARLSPTDPAPLLHLLDLLTSERRWPEAATVLNRFDKLLHAGRDGALAAAAASFRRALEMRDNLSGDGVEFALADDLDQRRTG